MRYAAPCLATVRSPCQTFGNRRRQTLRAEFAYRGLTATAGWASFKGRRGREKGPLFILLCPSVDGRC
jgi:hypothetical protein